MKCNPFETILLINADKSTLRTCTLLALPNLNWHNLHQERVMKSESKTLTIRTNKSLNKCRSMSMLYTPMAVVILEWSSITMFPREPLFHPMVPTDHCRLVSIAIFSWKVKWRFAPFDVAFIPMHYSDAPWRLQL